MKIPKYCLVAVLLGITILVFRELAFRARIADCNQTLTSLRNLPSEKQGSMPAYKAQVESFARQVEFCSSNPSFHFPSYRSNFLALKKEVEAIDNIGKFLTETAFTNFIASPMGHFSVGLDGFGEPVNQVRFLTAYARALEALTTNAAIGATRKFAANKALVKLVTEGAGWRPRNRLTLQAFLDGRVSFDTVLYKMENAANDVNTAKWTNLAALIRSAEHLEQTQPKLRIPKGFEDIIILDLRNKTAPAPRLAYSGSFVWEKVEKWHFPKAWVDDRLLFDLTESSNFVFVALCSTSAVPSGNFELKSYTKRRDGALVNEKSIGMGDAYTVTYRFVMGYWPPGKCIDTWEFKEAPMSNRVVAGRLPGNDCLNDIWRRLEAIRFE